MNFPILLLAAITPLVLGFIWYNPKVLGKAWMDACGLNEEKLKGANMGLIFGLTFFLSLLAAMAIQFMVIHQLHLGSIVQGMPGLDDPNSEPSRFVSSAMEKYGTNFRTFKHGALHGTIGGIFLALPIIAINALFERKRFKYVAINSGFWILCMAIMGGIICAFT